MVKKKKVSVWLSFSATSQCNRDISYCVTVDWHFEPQLLLGDKEWSSSLAGNLDGKV